MQAYENAYNWQDSNRNREPNQRQWTDAQNATEGLLDDFHWSGSEWFLVFGIIKAYVL